MISFSKLGNYGRLGNQLFQYAFLRMSARRLGTKFYCPRWDGDSIFDLDDLDDRESAPANIIYKFDQCPEAGFTGRALEIRDHTEIQGYFQSELYYPEKSAVRNFYRFKESIRMRVHELYSPDFLQNAVTISLRLDSDYASTRAYWPETPLSYYKSALRKALPLGPVLVLADRQDLAGKFLKKIDNYNLTFVKNLSPAEQMYLMTQCRSNIITNSTFAWWGAWLNNRPDKLVISPRYWCRPGVPNAISNILPAEWTLCNSTLPVWDHFQTWRLCHPMATYQRVRDRICAEKSL